MSEFGPSFYGEVLPTSSRAVDDEEDEDDTVAPTDGRCVLRWSKEALSSSVDTSGHPLISCNVLIVAINCVATAFIQSHFLTGDDDRELIGVICSGLSENSTSSLHQEDVTDETCYLYRLKADPSVVLCQCRTTTALQPELIYSFIDQLMRSISDTHTYVAVLSHQSANEYRCDNPSSSSSQVPFLRALKTPAFTGTPLCDYLEQPNIIHGLPAQLMTYCTIRSIPAILYVCYTENMYLDLPSLTEFSRLTHVTPFKDFYQKRDDVLSEMKKLIDKSNALNTLYT